jgi:Leucine-rich repeat (LRR) protein
MKKLLPYFFILFCLQFSLVKAQWVTIPDADFAAYLQMYIPSCMNGNQMDTTCIGVVSLSSISYTNAGMSDLTGLQYFDNLTYLNCMDNHLTSLPKLPSLLYSLHCNGNQLTSLPALPSALNTLNCFDNQLTSLPVLPNSLYRLDCSKNQITNLPQLPNMLEGLYCSNNLLTSLPSLPNSLKDLICKNNQIISLPPLPNLLEGLNCSNNLLDSLPLLPNSLNILNCDSNNISSLPILPDLWTLDCNKNQITMLPTLPAVLFRLSCKNNLLTSLPSLPGAMLAYIFCDGNQLTSLPTLPGPLFTLSCTSNQISSLPVLPNSLTNFYCDFNQLSNIPPVQDSLLKLECSYNLLTTLPPLPGVTTLKCNNNQLTYLPALNNNLSVLNCSNNQLNTLPPLPNNMTNLLIDSNNITCLYNLPQIPNGYLPWIANISGNLLTCVPNQTNYIGGLPLCFDNDAINNPNSCLGVNITGRVFKDMNSNCTYNNIDINTQNVAVKLYDTQNNFLAQSYTINGIYSFNSLLPDTYVVKIDTVNIPFTPLCSQFLSQSVTLNSLNQTIQNINIPVVCTVSNDFLVQDVHTQGWVFPGQLHKLRTNVIKKSNWYNLLCDTAQNAGMLSLQVSGPVIYVAPTIGALVPIVSGDTFTYNISNFNNLDLNSFGLQFLTDTSAQITDQICVHVEITTTPLDDDTTNNSYDFCYQVVNSYDPNMKEVYPVNVLPGYDDWFTYTIHFQNTGNAPAFNIRLRHFRC